MANIFRSYKILSIMSKTTNISQKTVPLQSEKGDCFVAYSVTYIHAYTHVCVTCVCVTCVCVREQWTFGSSASDTVCWTNSDKTAATITYGSSPPWSCAKLLEKVTSPSLPKVNTLPSSPWMAPACMILQTKKRRKNKIIDQFSNFGSMILLRAQQGGQYLRRWR